MGTSSVACKSCWKPDRMISLAAVKRRMVAKLGKTSTRASPSLSWLKDQREGTSSKAYGTYGWLAVGN